MYTNNKKPSSTNPTTSVGASAVVGKSAAAKTFLSIALVCTLIVACIATGFVILLQGGNDTGSSVPSARAFAYTVPEENRFIMYSNEDGDEFIVARENNMGINGVHTRFYYVTDALLAIRNWADGDDVLITFADTIMFSVADGGDFPVGELDIRGDSLYFTRLGTIGTADWGTIYLAGEITSTGVTSRSSAIIVASVSVDIVSAAEITAHNFHSAIEIVRNATVTIVGGMVVSYDRTTIEVGTQFIDNVSEAIVSSGTLNIEGGSVMNRGTFAGFTTYDDVIAVAINNTDTTVISGGTVCGGYNAAIFSNSLVDLEITGGTITSGIDMNRIESQLIHFGTITIADLDGIDMGNIGMGGSINITGGLVSNTLTAGHGTAISVVGVVLDSGVGLVPASSTEINISGTATVFGISNAVRIESRAVLNIYGAGVGIYNSDEGAAVLLRGHEARDRALYMTDGGILSQRGIAIHNEGSGDVVIIGGTVTALGNQGVAIDTNNGAGLRIGRVDDGIPASELRRIDITSANASINSGTIVINANGSGGSMLVTHGNILNTTTGTHGTAILHRGTIDITIGRPGVDGQIAWNATVSAAENAVRITNGARLNLDGSARLSNSRSGGAVHLEGHTSGQVALSMASGSSVEARVAGGANQRAIHNHGHGRMSFIGSTVSASGFANAIYNAGNGGMSIVMGATVSSSNASVIINRGTGLIDIGTGGTVSSSGNNASGMIVLHGGLVGENILIIGADGSVTSTSANAPVVNHGAGTVRIYGTLSGTHVGDATFHNIGSGILYLLVGGSITNDGASNHLAPGIRNSGTGTININGGTVSGRATASIVNDSTGQILVSSGNVHVGATGSNIAAIRNNSTGLIRITGGNFPGPSSPYYRFVLYGGEAGHNSLEIDGLAIRLWDVWGSRAIVRNSGSGTVHMTGSSRFEIAGNPRGIVNTANGTVRVDGNAAILGGNEGGIHNIANGTIRVEDQATIAANIDFYAIRNDSILGQIILTGNPAILCTGPAHPYTPIPNSVGRISVGAGMLSVEAFVPDANRRFSVRVLNPSNGAIVVRNGHTFGGIAEIATRRFFSLASVHDNDFRLGSNGTHLIMAQRSFEYTVIEWGSEFQVLAGFVAGSGFMDGGIIVNTYELVNRVTTIDGAINAIQIDAWDARIGDRTRARNVSITFSDALDGFPANVGTETIDFINGTGGRTWGNITLRGAVLSGATDVSLAIRENINVVSYMDLATDHMHAVWVMGNLSLRGGNITASSVAVTVWSGAFEMSAGTIVTTGNIAIHTESSGSVNILGGTITSLTNTIFVDGWATGAVTIGGTAIVEALATAPSAGSAAVVIDNNATSAVIIEGNARIQSQSTAVIMRQNSTSTLTIRGNAEVVGTTAIDVLSGAGGTITIEGNAEVRGSTAMMFRTGALSAVFIGDDEYVTYIAGTFMALWFDPSTVNNITILGRAVVRGGSGGAIGISGARTGGITIQGQALVTSAANGNEINRVSTIGGQGNLFITDNATVSATGNNATAVDVSGGNLTLSANAEVVAGGSGSVAINSTTSEVNVIVQDAAEVLVSGNNSTAMIVSGTVLITDNARVVASGTTNSAAIVNVTGATVTIDGNAMVSATTVAIDNSYMGGTIRVYGGTIDGNNGIAITTGNNLTINGSNALITASGSSHTIIAAGTQLIMSNGTVRNTGSSNAIFMTGGELTINTGAVVSAINGTGIVLSGTGTSATFNGGTISVTGTGNAIAVIDDASFVMNGAGLVVQANTGHAILLSDGSGATISAGTITSQNYAIYASAGGAGFDLRIDGAPVINGTIRVFANQLQVIGSSPGESFRYEVYLINPAINAVVARGGNAWQANIVSLNALPFIAVAWASDIILVQRGLNFEYTITGGGTAFNVLVETVAPSLVQRVAIAGGATLQNAINTIRGDASGNNSTIVFGEGSVLNASVGLTLQNDTVNNILWGAVTLRGSISSIASVVINSYISNVRSYANISGTNSVVDLRGSDASFRVVAGTISTASTAAGSTAIFVTLSTARNRIYVEDDAIISAIGGKAIEIGSHSNVITINGGIVSTNSGRAICLPNVGAINNDIIITGGQVRANTSGVAIRIMGNNNTVSISGEHTVVYSATTNATYGTIFIQCSGARVDAVLTISGGQVRNSSASSNSQTIRIIALRNFVFSGGTIESELSGVLDMGVQDRPDEGGTFNMSGDALIIQRAANASRAVIRNFGFMLNIADGTIESMATGNSNRLISNVGERDMFISGGTFLARGGVVVRNGYTAFVGGGNVVISGGTLTTQSTTMPAIQNIRNGTTVSIWGVNTVIASAAANAIDSVYDTSEVVLGGSPAITGAIRFAAGNLSVLTSGANIFNPGDRVYTIYLQTHTVGVIAVAGGSEFQSSFRLSSTIAEDYFLRRSNDDLVIGERVFIYQIIAGTVAGRFTVRAVSNFNAGEVYYNVATNIEFGAVMAAIQEITNGRPIVIIFG